MLAPVNSSLDKIYGLYIGGQCEPLHHCTSSNLRSKDYLGGKRSEELFFQVRGHIPFSFHFHGFRVTFVVITQAVISTHVDESTVAVVARTTGFIHVGSRS